jgi:hypothetical protein
VHLAHGELAIERGEVADPDATVRCSPTTLAGIVHMGMPAADAVAEGLLVLTGDATALDRLVDSVQMPEPLPA